jgi:DNA repair protein RadA/Sms
VTKSKKKFVCNSCGAEEIRWLGRCPACGEWNSFKEVRVAPPSGPAKGARGYASATGRDALSKFASQRGRGAHRSGRGAAGAGRAGGGSVAGGSIGAGSFGSGSLRVGAADVDPNGAVRPQLLARFESAETRRLAVEPQEVARVLGGGLVEGSVVLLGGEPGVGKSTLLTGLALWWVRRGVHVIYVAGEESPAQIRMRAERLGFDPQREEGFAILPEVCLEVVIEALYAERVEQLEAADAASGTTTPPSCVVIADSIQTLHSEHIDAYPGSPSQIRYCGGVLADFARRSGCPVFLVGHVTKTGELAGPKLLEHMVDTVLYFEGSGGVLSGRRGIEPGSAVCAVRNGTRTFLVEVQALVSPTRYGTPQRVVQGVDSKRVALLVAILEKRAGLDLGGCDIFVKIAGGGRIDDPAADLAITAALASSLREVPVPADTLVQGEVGLTGEVRGEADRADRLREASRHGFRRAILAAGGKQLHDQGLELVSVSSVEEAVALALEPRSKGRSQEASS